MSSPALAARMNLNDDYKMEAASERLDACVLVSRDRAPERLGPGDFKRMLELVEVLSSTNPDRPIVWIKYNPNQVRMSLAEEDRFVRDFVRTLRKEEVLPGLNLHYLGYPKATEYNWEGWERREMIRRAGGELLPYPPDIDVQSLTLWHRLKVYWEIKEDHPHYEMSVFLRNFIVSVN